MEKRVKLVFRNGNTETFERVVSLDVSPYNYFVVCLERRTGWSQKKHRMVNMDLKVKYFSSMAYPGLVRVEVQDAGK